MAGRVLEGEEGLSALYHIIPFGPTWWLVVVGSWRGRRDSLHCIIFYLFCPTWWLVVAGRVLEGEEGLSVLYHIIPYFVPHGGWWWLVECWRGRGDSLLCIIVYLFCPTWLLVVAGRVLEGEGGLHALSVS